MWWSFASLALALVALGLALYSRSLHKRMVALRDQKDPVRELFREFYEWGAATKVVVRDRKTHEFASEHRVLDLFLMFRDGHAFKNAKMLWQNQDFKVFVSGKRKEGE